MARLSACLYNVQVAQVDQLQLAAGATINQAGVAWESLYQKIFKKKKLTKLFYILRYIFYRING